MATISGFLYTAAHWHHLANLTEPSVCSGNAALCQITLTTCLWLFLHVFDFCFLSSSQEIGWEEHLRSDLFCVEWDVKP